MISWSLSQMVWWLSFINLTWVSDQSQPLIMLQEACILFWNPFCAILVVSSISEQLRHSPEANSKSGSAAFSLDSSCIDSSPPWSVLFPLLCSLVLFGAPTLLSCTSSGVLGGSSPSCSVLYPLLVLALVVSAWVLFPDWSLGAPLGEQSYFTCKRLMRNPTSKHPTGGVLI